MNKKELAAQLAAKHSEQVALLERGDGMTLDDLETAEKLQGEIEGLNGQLTKFDATAALQAKAAETNRFLTTAVDPRNAPPAPSTQAPPTQFLTTPGGTQASTLPAHVIRSKVHNFADRDGQSKELRCFQYGQWLLASCRKNKSALAYCAANGIPIIGLDEQGNRQQFAHTEIVNTAGGFLVPPQWEQDLIDLRERFGVARRILRIRPMTSDTLSVPRRDSGLTAYWIADNTAITESTKGWSLVTFSAKKTGVLAKLSSELGEDAIINVADDLAGEIAYAFSALEDDCAFNGDGTSTYGGMVGFRSAFTNLSGTIANIAGLRVATGTGYATAYESITLADFNAVKAKLPQYADGPRTGWVCHKSFFHGTMERLALAAGGVTAMEVQQGIGTSRGQVPIFLGYPVHFSQKMPNNPAVSQVVCLFGDFYLAAGFGDRRQTTIMVSEHSSFANDVLDIRGTQRFDVVVHDVGNASATAGLRVPGPVVGLITAAS